MLVAEFEINGIVTDSSNKPIQNIRIIKQEGRHTEPGDTLYTNSQGKYAFKFWGPDFVRLKVDDIDGEENGGEFESQEIDVRFTDADIVKKGRGNKTADKSVKTQNIKLERKTQNHEKIGY